MEAPGAFLASVARARLSWLSRSLAKPSGVFPMYTKRTNVNKSRSAKKFRNGVSHTRKINTAPPPMRGGYRL